MVGSGLGLVLLSGPLCFLFQPTGPFQTDAGGLGQVIVRLQLLPRTEKRQIFLLYMFFFCILRFPTL